MNERVKPLITYCENVSKSPQPEEVPTPPVPYPRGTVHVGRVRQISSHVGLSHC